MDPWVLGECAAKLIAARQNLQHPGGQDILEELAKPQRSHRCEGGRLDDDDVTRYQRRNELEHGREYRVIPYRDGADHPERRPAHLDPPGLVIPDDLRVKL